MQNSDKPPDKKKKYITYSYAIIYSADIECTFKTKEIVI